MPRKIDGAKVENVIVQTLESRPADATHFGCRHPALSMLIIVVAAMTKGPALHAIYWSSGD
jgi:hypothetical protein